MFGNISGWELLVIAVIAVIFVGPKDLPSMLRTFGRFSRKVRGIAGDFQRQVDDALREAELDDVRKSIEDVRSLSPKRMVTDQLKGMDDDLRADLDEVNETLDHPRKSDEASASKRIGPERPKNSGTGAVPGFASAEPESKPTEPKVDA